MELLKELLAADPSVPRLTCYDETTGGRTDLSAITMDNWASKIANMLHDEFDLDPGDSAWIDLPPIWQAACIVVGAERAGIELSDEDPLVVFTSVGKLSEWGEKFPDAYLAAVTDDVFGRGVVETGGEIPPGVVDFGPEVRLHPDAYIGMGPDAGQVLLDGATPEDLTARAKDVAGAAGLVDGARVISGGWSGGPSADEWIRSVLAAWSVGGAAVIVRGGDDERMARIAEIEKARPLG
ncbi:TIGR03089 family protein [Corynebacterium xerosis]|uniref:TIGR03089 family protein n=1 Tax=Corynebacterium xerosis TaxID=1725 RepID=A0A2N6T247_9CORY|nr:TIGR03089 family protein [Corynebacterium xerosis]PMC63363.1 TIGR03089 family protein [Corynebacterium xerosis]